MDTANVLVREVEGNLVLYDNAGNEILTVDGENRRVSFAPGAGLAAPLAIQATDIEDDTITRAKLVTESKFVDLEERLKGADGADLALSETAGDFFRNIGIHESRSLAL